MDHGDKECKKHDLGLEKLREKNEARAYVNNADEAMVKNY